MLVAKLVGAGIDYIRLTSDNERARARMRMHYLAIAERDRADGHKEVKGGAVGFWGDKSRHALYGEKDNWAMLQVSGYESRNAYLLSNDSNQCSRIDLQLTYQVEDGKVQESMEKLYCQAVNHKKTEGKPWAVKRIQEDYATQTIMIGKRASDVYIRIYDKYEESKKEEYKNCIRFELELKGRMSKAV